MQDRLIYAYDKAREFVAEHKKLSIGIGIVLIVVIVWSCVGVFYTHTDYTIKYDTSMEDSDGTAYESFHNNIVKYNSDGAALVTRRGSLVWNEAYDMSYPQMDMSSKYVAFYDRYGTKIYIMDDEKRVGLVTTSRPIYAAAVADNGSVGVLMNQKDTGYLEIRDVKGELIASGQVHAHNSGIPVDIAFSSDGKRLALSSLSYDTGKLRSVITFYDFTSSGRKRDDNIVATCSFDDVVMPQLKYMSGGNLVAFGDSEIVVFNDNFEPDVKKEIIPAGTIDSIFYNNEHFGYVGPESGSEGRTIRKLHIYSKTGWHKLNKEIDEPLSNVYMLPSDDVVFLSDKRATIHSASGVKKFDCQFEGDITKILYGGSSKDYIFVENGLVEEVRLR